MSSHAVIEDKPKFSIVWLIPVIALIITAWVLYDHQVNKGDIVYVQMKDAEGIISGKTELRVKSVKIGLVKSLKLELEKDSVIAEIRVSREYSNLLKEDSKIWIVKPRIDESGISGMSTLLSGVYLEFSPGQSDKQSSRFSLQEKPTLIGADVMGKRFTLTAENSEVLEPGTHIFFRNFPVGMIESADFNTETLKMNYGIFIDAPYSQLVTNNAIFYVSSGVDFQLSPQGIEFSTGSLSKIVKGGISFDYPPNEAPNSAKEAFGRFTLHKSLSVALEQRFELYDYYLVEFDQSIRGLIVGAPVEYRGMRIGTVEEVPAKLLKNNQPLYFQQDNTSIPVLIKVEYGRIYEKAHEAKAYWSKNLEKWIRNGLRASLKSGNLLTGAVYIELDYFSVDEQVALNFDSAYPVLPSVSSGITALSEQVMMLLDKANTLPIDTMATELNATITEYRQLAMEMNQLLKSFNENKTADKVDDNLEEIGSTLAQLTSSLKQFERTLTNYQQGSNMVEQLTDTLQELESLSKTFKPLSKSLNEQPNILLFNKQADADPEPRK